MQIDDKVKTPLGNGVIIGFDLSESSRAKRTIVKLDIDVHEFEKHHGKNAYCFQAEEIEVIGI